MNALSLLGLLSGLHGRWSFPTDDRFSVGKRYGFTHHYLGDPRGAPPAARPGKTSQNRRDKRSVIYFTEKGIETISYLDGGSTNESSVLPTSQQAKTTNPTPPVARRPTRTHRPLLAQTDKTSRLQTPQ